MCVFAFVCIFSITDMVGCSEKYVLCGKVPRSPRLGMVHSTPHASPVKKKMQQKQAIVDDNHFSVFNEEQYMTGIKKVMNQKGIVLAQSVLVPLMPEEYENETVNKKYARALFVTNQIKNHDVASKKGLNMNDLTKVRMALLDIVDTAGEYARKNPAAFQKTHESWQNIFDESYALPWDQFKQKYHFTDVDHMVLECKAAKKRMEYAAIVPIWEKQ